MHLSRTHLLSLPLLLAVLSCAKETNTSSRSARETSADQTAAPAQDTSQSKYQKPPATKPTADQSATKGANTASAPPPAPVKSEDKPAEVPQDDLPDFPASKLGWDGQKFQGDVSFALIPTE